MTNRGMGVAGGGTNLFLTEFNLSVNELQVESVCSVDWVHRASFN